MLEPLLNFKKAQHHLYAVNRQTKKFVDLQHIMDINSDIGSQLIAYATKGDYGNTFRLLQYFIQKNYDSNMQQKQEKEEKETENSNDSKNNKNKKEHTKQGSMIEKEYFENMMGRALVNSSQAGQFKIVQLLISFGANVNYQLSNVLFFFVFVFCLFFRCNLCILFLFFVFSLFLFCAVVWRTNKHTQTHRDHAA